MLWRKECYDLYVGQQMRCMVLPLTALSTEQSRNSMLLLCIKHIYSEAEKRLVAVGPLPFLRSLNEEHANLEHISGCQYSTGHAGISFEL